MPTVDIPDKICSHCGGTKWYNSPKNLSFRCSKCLNKRYKVWRNSKLEEFRKKHRDYYRLKVNKKDKQERAKRFKLKNPHKDKEYKDKYSKTEKGSLNIKLRRQRITTNLEDSYVKTILTKHSDLSSKDVPQELIEIKRKQLLLIRQIKNNG